MFATEHTTHSSSPMLSFELPLAFRGNTASTTNAAGARGFVDSRAQTFRSATGDALIHVCPFRPAQGHFAQLVQRTLLRDWVPVPYNGAYVLEDKPLFQHCTVRAAQEAYLFAFQESDLDSARFHMCLGMRVGRTASLIELDAKNASAWQRHAPEFDAMLRSLQVIVADPFRIEGVGSWAQPGY